MSKKPRLKVIDESPSGLNRKFEDTQTGKTYTRGQVADNIDKFPDYHVMKKDNKRIIRSNPNSNTNDNLE